MAIMVGAAELHRRGKAFHTQLFHACRGDVERFKAAPNVLAVDHLLAYDLLSGTDVFGDQNGIPDGAIVEVLAHLVFRGDLALALVDNVFDDVLHDREVGADRVEIERAVALRLLAGRPGVIIVARPPHPDHAVHRKSDLGRFLDRSRIDGTPTLQIYPI